MVSLLNHVHPYIIRFLLFLIITVDHFALFALADLFELFLDFPNRREIWVNSLV